jgi:hypothetical protein
MQICCRRYFFFLPFILYQFNSCFESFNCFYVCLVW